MQRNLVSLLLITASLGTIVSCNNADKAGIAIPKDATMVVHINAPSITSKVNWQEIQQTEWFKQLYTESTDTLTKTLLDDPTKAGVDLKADLAFFLKKQGEGGYAAFEGSVSDASAFEEFNKKINKGGTPTKQGDINILKMGLHTILAWNNKRFVYVMDSPMPGANSYMPDSAGNYSGPFQFPVDSLQKFGVQLFDLDKKNSLTTDERFASLIKENADIHFWSNAGQYLSGLSGMLSMLRNLSDLVENNVAATTLNFENGKITMKTKSYYNDKWKALMDKYPPGEVSADVINRIPSQNVAAVIAMKYPPAGLKDLLKLFGVDGIVNSYLAENQYSIDEFIKANKGDLLLSVSDFSVVRKDITIPNPEGEPYSMPSTTPDAKVLFATSINDKAAFDKLVGIVKAQLPQDPSGTLSKISYQLNDQWFAASNSPEHVNGFLAGGSNKQPFASRIGGKAFGAYFNVQNILRSSQSGVTDSASQAVLDASIKMWNDVIVTSGGKKDNYVTGEAEINLVDKNTNSLKQLNNYFNTLSIIFKKKEREYNVHVEGKAFVPVWASY